MDGPFGKLGEAAIVAHELFKALLVAGFTEKQALTIVVGVIVSPKEGSHE